MTIDAKGIGYKELNQEIADAESAEVVIENVCGQRYIGCGLEGYHITLNGTPGNALAAYMNGSTVVVSGNAQDATGDTMNSGKVVIHGNCGDTCGYAMRGGEILIQGNTGCRTGIHMKEYGGVRPVIIVGGSAGDFLGEYLAGGIIIVLNLHDDGVPVGTFCGTGMHGGRIFIRAANLPAGLPKQVKAADPDESDMKILAGYIEEYCSYFGSDAQDILQSEFIKLVPNSSNPYKQLYTKN